MAQKTWMICSKPKCKWAIEWPLDQNPRPNRACEDCEPPTLALARCRRCDHPITSKTANTCSSCHQPLRGPLPVRQLTVTALLGEVVAALGHRAHLTTEENRWITRRWSKGALETEVEQVVAALKARRSART